MLLVAGPRNMHSTSIFVFFVVCSASYFEYLPSTCGLLVSPDMTGFAFFALRISIGRLALGQMYLAARMFSITLDLPTERVINVVGSIHCTDRHRSTDSRPEL